MLACDMHSDYEHQKWLPEAMKDINKFFVVPAICNLVAYAQHFYTP